MSSVQETFFDINGKLCIGPEPTFASGRAGLQETAADFADFSRDHGNTATTVSHHSKPVPEAKQICTGKEPILRAKVLHSDTLKKDKTKAVRYTTSLTEEDHEHAILVSSSTKSFKPLYKRNPDKKDKQIFLWKSYCKDGKLLWPHEFPSVIKMIEADLKYIGDDRYTDLVECIHCGGTLYKFKPEDDPIQEHRRIYPDCNGGQ